ncbi:unnamed protein product [Triticum turgidum subsp. durum]|uniref:AUGMIN subunit 2 n=1 Tax=Triticum turgidum subsp. durum TaxID=4567 RepID=A0A9R0ZLM3_TRITD|nr:unnamed protein product [Triticum turgidum subsp. durum]
MAAAQKPAKRLGGMAEALAIAGDLGFPAPPAQVTPTPWLRLLSIRLFRRHFARSESPGRILVPFSSMKFTVLRITKSDGDEMTILFISPLQEDQNTDKSDDLVRVLRELTVVQRNIANLQVELQGRKDDKNIAHLTHVSEMEKKCESLARITAILKDVIQNKDRIIARLQQPYSLDCIPVEAEYQKQFSELLLKAASDYGALTASVGDFQWSQNFRESPAVWGEMLRPIPAALASCTRFFEAMSAMRESFSTLQTLRVGPSLSMTPGGSSDDSKFLTPPQWREGSMLNSWNQVDDVNPESDGLDSVNQRRLSWPSSINRDL